MSTYQSTAAGPTNELSTGDQRPRTLTLAVSAAVGVAMLNIISAITVLTSKSDMIREQIAGHSGGAPVSLDQVDLSSERAQGLQTMYTSLATSTIFWSIVLALLASFTLRGGRATRVCATIILVVSALFKIADAVMATPAISLVADLVIVILGPVAGVLYFMRATNDFGKHRRTSK
jgi:hypothetical protein